MCSMIVTSVLTAILAMISTPPEEAGCAGSDSVFTGTYQVASPDYVGERCIIIEEAQQDGLYTVYTHSKGMPDLYSTAIGFTAYGFLGTMGGVDMPSVCIYTKQGTELSCLVTAYKYIGAIAETTSLAKPLTISNNDYTGTYELTGNTDTGDYSPFLYTVHVDECGPLWYVVYESSASQVGHGVGIAVEDVLVVGFVDNIEDPEIWILRTVSGTDGLEGRWIYRFNDWEDNEVIMDGWLSAEKVNAESQLESDDKDWSDR